MTNQKKNQIKPNKMTQKQHKNNIKRHNTTKTTQIKIK